MYQKLLTFLVSRGIFIISKETNVKINTRTTGTGEEIMKRTYGYCRISRKTQNIERQERNPQILTDQIDDQAGTFGLDGVIRVYSVLERQFVELLLQKGIFAGDNDRIL